MWTREQTTAAEAHADLERDDGPLDDSGAPEDDDAPPMDDVPDSGSDGTEDDADETDADDRDPHPAYAAWPRLSIWPTPDGSFDYSVSLPRARRASIVTSSAYLQRNCEELARTLIARQSASLGAYTLPEAYLALEYTPMRSLERSVGQGSRDRLVLVQITAGLVPLGFFASRSQTPDLSESLVAVARFAAGNPQIDKLTDSMIASVVPNSSISANGLNKQHGASLIALRDNPAILRRHRSLWPYTSTDALYDELEMTGNRRSTVAAMLALTDCIFTEAALACARWATEGPR